MTLAIEPRFCPHGMPEGMCKQCLVAGFTEKKKIPIKSLKQRSEHQERLIAKDYREAGFPKAQRIAMSGAIATMKGDVNPGELFLVEAKETRRGSLTINPEWVWKVRKEAADMGRKGWYALHAWVAEGSEHYTKVVMVEENLWMEILEGYNANRRVEGTENAIRDGEVHV